MNEMNTVIIRKGQDRPEALRMRMVTSRMVGMYRLMNEQVKEEKTNTMLDYTSDHSPYSKWSKFRTILYKNLYDSLTSRKSMLKTIRIASKDTGSLKDLLWDKGTTLPQQSVSIKIGNIMEKSVAEFFRGEFSDWSSNLKQAIKDFADYNIQMDVASKKGNDLIIAELKYNLNLDTEKAKAVIEKLDLLNVFAKDHVKEIDKNIKPNICFVSLRYPTVKDIPKIKPVLESVRSQYIVGYQEFFNFFDINVTETMWKNLHDKIAKEVNKSFELYKDEV
jgi:hypothetical protein